MEVWISTQATYNYCPLQKWSKVTQKQSSLFFIRDPRHNLEKIFLTDYCEVDDGISGRSLRKINSAPILARVGPTNVVDPQNSGKGLGSKSGPSTQPFLVWPDCGWWEDVVIFADLDTEMKKKKNFEKYSTF